MALMQIKASAGARPKLISHDYGSALTQLNEAIVTRPILRTTASLRWRPLEGIQRSVSIPCAAHTLIQVKARSPSHVKFLSKCFGRPTYV